MMISCFATAHYLNKHMKSLSASDGSLSSPRLHSQIRVTVTGILQGVLCFLCAMQNLLHVMSYFLSSYFSFDYYIHITVINLYILGTTGNLGGLNIPLILAILLAGFKTVIHQIPIFVFSSTLSPSLPLV
ncbi:unnamed protein product [Arctogadus glacialis]